MPWNLADAARRYEAGESLAQIAQALDTPETTVYRRLVAGGLPPRATAPWAAQPHRTRNYARERARHTVLAPDKQRAVYHLLRSQIPDKELPLVGGSAILAWLHGLGLRRPNGGPMSSLPGARRSGDGARDPQRSRKVACFGRAWLSCESTNPAES
jgi:hypothetical protein